MGQMHVQRAIEMPDGPRVVVATDLDRGRLDHLVHRFGAMAAAKGMAFHTLAPADFANTEAMDARLAELAPRGYSDIAIMVPVAALVPQYLKYAADGAFVNIFAGVGIGSNAAFHLRDLCRGIKLIGSSGSRIADMRKVLDKVERGELNTNLSVAAIGGLNAAKDGLEAVRDAKFPGKTVLYTQILDLPLTPLEELPKRLPEVAARLSPEGAWTLEAEQALLEHFGHARA
jgi:threonine dehydrogenase-like Zn-dependent dehydrogenase